MSTKITHEKLVKLLKWIHTHHHDISREVNKKLMDYNNLDAQEKISKRDETIDFINKKLREIKTLRTFPVLSATEEKRLIENIHGIDESELSEIDSFDFDSKLFKGGKRKNKKTNKKRRKGGTKKRSNKNMNK